MRSSLIIIALFSLFMSCSKHDVSSDPIMASNIVLTGHEQDSILLNYVGLSEITYSLDISFEDAKTLGVTKVKYDETIQSIDNLNKYIAERKDSGDIIQCLPPKKMETQTKYAEYVDSKDRPLLYSAPIYPEYYHYFLGPRTVCVFVGGSGQIYSTTMITVEGSTSTVNYTIASTHNDPTTSVFISHPSPALYQIPPGKESFEDDYNTHEWIVRFKLNCYCRPYPESSYHPIYVHGVVFFRRYSGM